MLKSGEAAADEQLVPTSAVLVEQEDGFAAGADTGVEARGLDLHQRDEAVNLGLCRGKFSQDASEA